MQKQIDHYQNEFSSVWENLPGYKVSWLDRLRLNAINQFTESGFPKPRAEDWKYTDLSALTSRPYEMHRTHSSTVEWKEVKDLIPEVDAAMTLVFINGKFNRIVGEVIEGVQVLDLKEAISKHAGLLKELLSQDEPSLSAFETLNTAFMADGVCVVLEPNVQLTSPIQIIHYSETGESTRAFNTRNLFLFKENSKAEILENYLSNQNGNSYLMNHVNRIVLEAGAKVEYSKIQNEDSVAFHFGVNRVSLKSNSHFASSFFSFGAALSRENLKLDFDGEGAHGSVNGLFMVDSNRQADIYTNLEHKVANCSSDEIVKGVLENESKAVFRGKIKVFENAQKTDARLNNSNLLLSNAAEVNTMPQLEIYADDVKCSHGSASGHLDEDQLFYLLSRGVDETSANSLLIYAFANSVVETIKSESMRKFVKETMMQKLPAQKELKEVFE